MIPVHFVKSDMASIDSISSGVFKGFQAHSGTFVSFALIFLVFTQLYDLSASGIILPQNTAEIRKSQVSTVGKDHCV